MDKNSLILEIKNDLNSIKKQVEVTLAKLDVLEALIKLEIRNEELGVRNSCASESRSRACSDYAERSQESPLGSEELGVKEEPKPEPIVESMVGPEPEPMVEPEPEPEPMVEPEPEPEVEVESIVEVEVEPESVTDPVEVPTVEIVEEIEEIEEEITPHSSLLTPNFVEATPLRNLMSVIGLNDRFRFRHDLFSNSDDLFKETIEILNSIESFENAVEYLTEKFEWDAEDATVVYFYDIIKPKF